jgi:hypothetical protein
MPLPQKKLIPSILLLLALFALAGPPLWWSQGSSPVLVPNAPQANKAPANIGQAKHMVSEALKALEAKSPTLAADVRASLLAANPNLLTVPNPKTPEWSAQQKAPLLLGQLKALALPFYNRLNTAKSSWVLDQITLNHANAPVLNTHYWQVTGNPAYTEGGYYPWNLATPKEINKAPANIGQLKAVFALRFDTLPNTTPPPIATDSDGDGMPDAWEIQYGLNPNDPSDAAADANGDGITNLQSFLNGISPIGGGTSPNSVKTELVTRGIFKPSNKNFGTIFAEFDSIGGFKKLTQQIVCYFDLV